MSALRWLHRKILLPEGYKIEILFKQFRTFCVTPLPVERLSVTMYHAEAPSKRVSKGVRLTDYDCIGFDLDNTVCRYKIGSMIKLEYELLAKYLIEEKGYPADHLMRPIENNLDFMLKGLILDVRNGNLLRITPTGHIVHGSHGTTELTKEELQAYYGPDRRWDVTDAFTKDPLHTWNGPFSEQMRTLLDYFDMPTGLVFARVVDSLDEKNGKRLESYSIWPDLLQGIQQMFQREHFQLNRGGYFEAMKSQPANYIHKCSDDLINWFKNLRNKNKLLFLITGSNIDFASHTASNSMGTNWQEMLDIVICYAKKPGFFTSNRSFITVNGFEEVGPIDNKDLQLGGIYTHGNWTGLYEFLKKHSKKDNPKIVYIGDNLVQDVYTPAVHTGCDTIAISEELEAEGAFGHDPVHTDLSVLTSCRWGSYFSHRDYNAHTIWHNIIYKHSKACVPSLEYVAKKAIDQEYYPIENYHEY